MSSITNINNNSSVVNVGRTTPVTPGAKEAAKSIPVVFATDQQALPVEEQNAIKSEVSLSLLGIPRAEVALGIFADVNTYDVNPSEWSSFPQSYINGFGIKHLPQEAGALVEAKRDSFAVLTSKRFFRYQPGRVSSATFGIKTTVSEEGFSRNPVIRKYGIFDNFDGYYWETRQNGVDDNFTVVRRSQSLFTTPASPYGEAGDNVRAPSFNSSATSLDITQIDDYRYVGKAPSVEETTLNLQKDVALLKENRFILAKNAYDTANTGVDEEKCLRDLDFWIDMYVYDLSHGGDAHTALNTKNYETAILSNSSDEVDTHTALRTEILNLASLSTTATNRLSTLTNIPITFFGQANPQQNPIDPTSYGNKSVIDTLFDTRKYYWSYYVSQFTANGETITYDEYVKGDRTFTADEVKFKCQRDVVYIIDGYKNDLAGGGNAATKYNASMYYQGSGLSIGSQSNTEVELVEAERHTHLKSLILSDLQDSNTFSFSTTTINNFDTLSNIIIGNFSEEDISVPSYGTRAVPGNLVVLRDGLVMVHAGVYDPSLLKEQKKIRASIDTSANTSTFKITEDVVTFGQHVKYFGDDNGDLVDGTLYKVKSVIGPKGNEFTLINDNEVDVAANSSVDDVYFQIVNPFVFPKSYDPNVYTANEKANDEAFTGNGIPQGAMFPYMYAENGNLNDASTEKVGFINTTLADSSGYNTLRTQIDDVNFVPEYINWIQNNVNPEYYGVYEYRVPRSRFSNDHLNGKSANYLYYSDVSVGESGRVLPGDRVVENFTDKIIDSVYDFDFTKVTMLKIEFSWYGAVGALFLAYVPVNNDEARWVRVHHLRASNQLKMASLGNATLPITYNIWGGGSDKSLGQTDSAVDYNYGSNSHHIVKYGASYYIDGGDRGTVRLYSHTNNNPEIAYGRKHVIGSVVYKSGNTGFTELDNLIYFDRTTGTDGIDNEFFMKADVITNNRADQNIKVVWVDDERIYLSSRSEPLNSNVTLINKRPNAVYGLETKRNIISSQGNKVRNRIQVYPTKLSTVNFSPYPVKLRMRKTPIFQNDITPSANSFSLTEEFTITSQNLPLPTNDTNYLSDGEEIYGWFRVSVEGESQTSLGKLYKEAGSFYFEQIDVFNGIVSISPNVNFLPDKRFNADATQNIGFSSFDKEGLSSIQIVERTQVPIPETGTDISTIFMESGSEQVNLDTYYDYNKEYLSFPLTDIADTLYFSVDINANNTINSEVSLGVTWEEQ